MLRRRSERLITLALTAALLALAATPWATVAAQELPPRPTAAPPPAPPTSDDNRSRRDDEPAIGRITGTVIDQTTGAPVPGALVQVGDATVTTDANGNYDRPGLAPGSYTVALLPAEGRAAPAQAAIQVALAAGATIVQHLAFQALPAPAEPAPVPAEPAPAPAEPAPIPAALPATGGEGAASTPLAAIAVGMLAAGALLARRGRPRRFQ